MTMSPSASVIQYLLKNRAVTLKNLKDFVSQISVEESHLPTDQLLEGIRSKLDNFNLTIDLVKCELTGNVFCVCIPTVERQCFADYPVLSKEAEQCMFALIDIILNNNGSPIYCNDALNILTRLDQLEMLGYDRAIDIINSLVAKKILVDLNGESYVLGPLVLASLRTYLSKHENAKVCAMCKKDAIYSKMCDHCCSNLHYYCYQNAQVNESEVCPVCRR